MGRKKLPEGEEKVFTTLRLDPKLHRRLLRVMERTGKTKTALIEEALRRHLR